MQTPPPADSERTEPAHKARLSLCCSAAVSTNHGDQYKPALFSNAFAAETCPLNVAHRLKTQRQEQRQGLNDGPIAQTDAFCGCVSLGDVKESEVT